MLLAFKRSGGKTTDAGGTQADFWATELICVPMLLAFKRSGGKTAGGELFDNFVMSR
jgi:hypothetical protein